MAYISFLSDEHLLSCIETLYNVYEKSKDEFTLDKFYKNQIDPIKLLFDINFFGISEEEVIAREIQRKIDKTISNAIGTFHEELLGGINGYTKHPVGNGFDITDNQCKSLFADIKNKHNTVKGSDLPNLYTDLEAYVNGKPNAKSYWVQIISSGQSFNENWTIPSHNKNNSNVYKVSADKFYEVLTGKSNAFSELCSALPIAIEDFLNSKQLKPTISNINVYKKLCAKALKNNVSLSIQLMNDTFRNYNGFPIKNNI
ncbi:Eco47II family restriction endonuclease [Clostridium botulinum]|nr:Eco47II family restriction endonuclease [Clostridium botulinum]NFO56057.1 Eco47II family restriction endonuclease [Clostridium botulinum]NFR13984.1 Eco47II family restriction endonuclease [Clostridium botulinum]NFR44460.1 Eco47II family restriction endonuclease [Clostridium botulinum]NFS49994.1 Eco47II family restriction endonuclease [Clostridium botulinum]